MDLIHFSCPKCSKKLKTACNAAGRKFQCKDCGNIAFIPKVVATTGKIRTSNQELGTEIGSNLTKYKAQDVEIANVPVIRKTRNPFLLIAISSVVGLIACLFVGFALLLATQEKVSPKKSAAQAYQDGVEQCLKDIKNGQMAKVDNGGGVVDGGSITWAYEPPYDDLKTDEGAAWVNGYFKVMRIELEKQLLEAQKRHDRSLDDWKYMFD